MFWYEQTDNQAQCVKSKSLCVERKVQVPAVDAGVLWQLICVVGGFLFFRLFLEMGLHSCETGLLQE